MPLQIFGVTGLPEIEAGTDLGAVIGNVATANGTPIVDGDIVVVTSKVVSKAEGRTVELASIERAFALCALYAYDALAHASHGDRDAQVRQRLLAKQLRAQRLALLAPARVLSLASIMSSSGARGLPEASPEVTRVLLSRPAGTGIDAAINHSVRLFKTIGSPGFPMSDAELREIVGAAARRSFYPMGILRQMVAVLADRARAAALAGVAVPTLVVHGKADPLVPFACGEDTARRIPGARLAGIEGMGHDLPPGVVDRLLKLLIPHFDAANSK